MAFEMDGKRGICWRVAAAAAILGLLGVAILGIWAVNVSGGLLAEGLATVENNTLDQRLCHYRGKVMC